MLRSVSGSKALRVRFEMGVRCMKRITFLQDLHERISNAGSSTTTSFKCGFRSTHQPVTTPLLEK